MYASNIDKSGKVHKGKYVKAGECVFPFRYKNKLYNKCLDTGKGPWCATSIKSKKAIDTWGYCVDDDVVMAAMNLKKMSKKKSNNVVSKTKERAALMRKEFLKLSKKYKKFKANQIIKKKMARRIKSKNLRNTIRKIKSKKNKNKNNSL